MRFVFLAIFLFSTMASAAEVNAKDSLPAVAASDAASEETRVNAEAEKKAPVAESEIALNLDKAKKAPESESSGLRIFFSLAVLAAVAGGGYVFLKKYAVPRAMKNQTQIKVLQQHYLGPKKSLAIVRVAGESILIGVTDHNISMIKSLALLDDEVPEETPHMFESTLKSYTGTAPQASEASGDEEDFSFGGIKDVVAKRLKGMRSLE